MVWTDTQIDLGLWSDEVFPFVSRVLKDLVNFLYTLGQQLELHCPVVF